MLGESELHMSGGEVDIDPHVELVGVGGVGVVVRAVG